MFIEVQRKLKTGELINQFINISQISYMQEITEPNPQGHKTVMFTNNGFALYSQAEPKALLQWYQGADISNETLIQQEYNTEFTDH